MFNLKKEEHLIVYLLVPFYFIIDTMLSFLSLASIPMGTPLV